MPYGTEQCPQPPRPKCKFLMKEKGPSGNPLKYGAKIIPCSRNAHDNGFCGFHGGKGRSGEPPRCERCCGRGELHWHHIQRKSEGFGNNPENMSLICRWCHEEWHALFEPLDSSQTVQKFQKWVRTPPIHIWIKMATEYPELTLGEALTLWGQAQESRRPQTMLKEAVA